MKSPESLEKYNREKNIIKDDGKFKKLRENRDKVVYPDLTQEEILKNDKS